MPDPFEELRDLGAGLPAQPLPAAEVRRRGDRMRRRRTVFQAAGAGLAVAVVAGGGLWVGDGVVGTAPDRVPATPAPSATASATVPPGGWRAEIPDGFPLGVGLPQPEPRGDVPPWSTSDAVDVAWSLLPCSDPDTGQSSLPSDDARTDASFIFAQSPARSFVRHLVVYRDGTAAATAADQILEQSRECGPQEAIPGITELRWEVSPTRAFGAGEAWLVSGGEYDVATDGRGTSRALLAVVRHGNALLVARLGDESAVPDPADLSEQAASEWVGHVATMSDAMCVFSVAGCTASDGPAPDDGGTGEPGDEDLAGSEAGATLIPDGFHLAAGMPRLDGDSERTTSTDRGRVLAFDPCHREGGHPAGPARTDFAQVVQTVPAGAYVHQVAVYLDAAAADEALGRMVQDLETCSPYEYADGVSEDRWTQLDSDQTRFRADGAVVAVSHGYTDGMRTTLASHHIAIRVGNAVLVVVRHGEFGAAPDDSGTAAVDREQRDVVAALIAQMCPFAGPSSELDCGSSTTVSGGLGTLDPGGLGPIRLGMTAADVEATGVVTLEDGHGTSCTSFGVLSDGDVLATGSISAEHGVESISVEEGAATPEGVGLGSTIEEVRTSYAHLVGDETLMSATASDAAAYWFELGDGVVTGLRLQLVEGGCS